MILLNNKQEIAVSYGPRFPGCVTKAWGENINKLAKVVEKVSAQGSEMCVGWLLYGTSYESFSALHTFSELLSLSLEKVDSVRRVGTAAATDIVDNKEAWGWQNPSKILSKTISMD
ncbi:hypothetical protein BDP27DRAFT_1364756 [Rhodocollybia butyracea]|uniref:Uncharacterized protein n=1 Tax=Rhodocollybia butyracea TaxID=206335 RepID=A0A9P5U764_9AGAR|nr:hypothetical protein BDP27DRAFT_1364756 [Rhodocollybia butyracea]